MHLFAILLYKCAHSSKLILCAWLKGKMTLLGICYINTEAAIHICESAQLNRTSIVLVLELGNTINKRVSISMITLKVIPDLRRLELNFVDELDESLVFQQERNAFLRNVFLFE